jgi:hypothetical protein
MVRYQYRTILIPGRPAASQSEHAAIVEAVIAGRPERAEEAMRDHLFNVAEALQRGLVPGIDRASRGVIQAGGEGLHAAPRSGRRRNMSALRRGKGAT